MLGFLPVLWSRAEEIREPVVSVTGTAVVEAVPDELSWRVEIKNIGPDLSVVADKHATKLAEVIELITAQGVVAKDIQTSQMQFGRNRVYRRNEWTEEGYVASTSVMFKINDLTKYKAVWLALAATSGVSVEAVEFGSSKRIELRKEARRKALLAAREKAGDMAATLDAKIGAPVSIVDDTSAVRFGTSMIGSNSISNSNTVSPANGASDDGEIGGSIAPGTLPIFAKVTVVFQLMPSAK